MNEDFEDAGTLIFQLDDLVHGFLEPYGESCSEELGVVGKKALVDNEAFVIAADDDGGEVGFGCAGLKSAIWC